MEKKNELTGIECQLVLKYLTEEKPPLVVYLKDNEKNLKIQVNTGIQTKENLKNGQILIQNNENLADIFVSVPVLILFYFNKLGLYFQSEIKKVGNQYFFSIPSVIKKISDNENKNSDNYYGILAFNSMDGENKIQCDFEWEFFGDNPEKSIELYFQKNSEEPSSVENRCSNLKIIHLDSKTVTIGFKDSDFSFSVDCDYYLTLHIPIAGPLKERKISVKINITNLFKSEKTKKSCIKACFTSIKEEDQRFLQDFHWPFL